MSEITEQPIMPIFTDIDCEHGCLNVIFGSRIIKGKQVLTTLKEYHAFTCKDFDKLRKMLGDNAWRVDYLEKMMIHALDVDTKQQ